MAQWSMQFFFFFCSFSFFVLLVFLPNLWAKTAGFQRRSGFFCLVVRGVYPPHTISGLATKKTLFFMCVIKCIQKHKSYQTTPTPCRVAYRGSMLHIFPIYPQSTLCNVYNLFFRHDILDICFSSGCHQIQNSGIPSTFNCLFSIQISVVFYLYQYAVYNVYSICTWVMGCVVMSTWPQSPPFPQKLATALKNKTCTLHSAIHVYDV